MTKLFVRYLFAFSGEGRKQNKTKTFSNTNLTVNLLKLGISVYPMYLPGEVKVL